VVWIDRSHGDLQRRRKTHHGHRWRVLQREKERETQGERERERERWREIERIEGDTERERWREIERIEGDRIEGDTERERDTKTVISGGSSSGGESGCLATGRLLVDPRAPPPPS